MVAGRPGSCGRVVQGRGIGFSGADQFGGAGSAEGVGCEGNVRAFG